MAFPTGHNQPTGFVAGQLRDGSSFGNYGPIDFGNPSQKVRFFITLRYYKSTLIPVVGITKEDGVTIVEAPTIKQSQYLLNIAGLFGLTGAQTLRDLAALAPNEAKLVTLGVASNQLVPVNPTNELIPFAMNADGKVEAYVSSADQAKAAADAAKLQQDALTKLTNNIVGTNNATNTGTGTGSGTLAGMTNTTKILIGVAVAVVVGVIIMMATKKKPAGRR